VNETTDRARAGETVEDRLRRRFRVTETRIMVRDHKLALLHPANADDLISEEDFERDERLPYWADLWPSAFVLAGRMADTKGGGRRLLELGCGAGLVATVAALSGFEVTASDYYDDALLFAKANAWRNGARIETRNVDWRGMPGDLTDFDVVVASDVLYEPRYGDLVAGAFAATLGKRAIGLLTDPGRIAAESFVEACKERRLVAQKRDKVSYDRGDIRQKIDVYEITWR
jgi:predicted nicotinamide N-methyase